MPPISTRNRSAIPPVADIASDPARAAIVDTLDCAFWVSSCTVGPTGLSASQVWKFSQAAGNVCRSVAICAPSCEPNNHMAAVNSTTSSSTVRPSAQPSESGV